MKNKVKILIIPIFLFILIGLVFTISNSSIPVIAGDSTSLTPSPSAKGTPVLDPNPRSLSLNSRPLGSQDVGMPALKPHLNADATASNGADTISPTFAEADIKQYVATHPVARRIKATSPITVEKIQYLTRKEVRSILGGDGTTFSDNDPMCLVTLNGTFILEGPNGVAVTYQKAIELFDAHTGNLVMSGTSH
jgi:hypothetical protein